MCWCWFIGGGGRIGRVLWLSEFGGCGYGFCNGGHFDCIGGYALSWWSWYWWGFRVVVMGYGIGGDGWIVVVMIAVTRVAVMITKKKSIYILGGGTKCLRN